MQLKPQQYSETFDSEFDENSARLFQKRDRERRRKSTTPGRCSSETSVSLYIYLSTTIAPRRCKRIPKRTITSGWKREAAAVPLRRANNNRPRTTLERGVLSRDEWKEHARGIPVCTPGGESFCFRDSELIALSPPRCPDTFPSPPPSCLHPSLAKPKRAREFDERSRAEEIHATETNVA